MWGYENWWDGDTRSQKRTKTSPRCALVGRQARWSHCNAHTARRQLRAGPAEALALLSIVKRENREVESRRNGMPSPSRSHAMPSSNQISHVEHVLAPAARGLRLPAVKTRSWREPWRAWHVSSLAEILASGREKARPCRRCSRWLRCALSPCPPAWEGVGGVEPTEI